MTFLPTLCNRLVVCFPRSCGMFFPKSNICLLVCWCCLFVDVDVYRDKKIICKIKKRTHNATVQALQEQIEKQKVQCIRSEQGRESKKLFISGVPNTNTTTTSWESFHIWTTTIRSVVHCITNGTSVHATRTPRSIGQIIYCGDITFQVAPTDMLSGYIQSLKIVVRADVASKQAIVRNLCAQCSGM